MAVNEVDIRFLEELGRGSYRLVDVRESHEYEAGHIPGAANLPLSELAERVEELRGAGELYLVCQLGGRSMKACEFAATFGIEASNVQGGTSAWIERGNPVVMGSSLE